MRTIFLAVVVTSLAAAAPAASRIHLIPQPVSLEARTGSFQLTATTPIVIAGGSAEAKQNGEYLSKALAAPTGFQLKVVPGKDPAKGDIVLAIAEKAAGEHKEGYELESSASGVRITAPTGAGLFYGVQTLLGLLPPQIESKQAAKAAWTIPAVKITDYPRFAWRGLMLDCSRHFFSKQVVKDFIDQMVKYKYNTFHWHLVDDEGWRIEIKSLPQLTKVGAWRVPRMGRWGKRPEPREGEAATDGGFYTQDDIREIIAYAKARYVTIIPEIETPGHSLAALASYPELSCTGGPLYVNPGSDFYMKVDNAFCPGNEKTFEFMDKVYTEVAALFPGPYIHIGGDECYKGFWKKCPKCQKRMADEGLKTEEELQSYLVRRAEKIIEFKGKRLIGWDEILEGGLAPNATVMSWRGMKGGIAAAQMKHEVVMTPYSHVYIDLYQGDPSTEPDTYGYVPVSKTYQFEPVPDEVDPKYVLGGQANLWAENVPTVRQAQYMTWPRSLAVAEVLWSPKKARDWNEFVGRIEANFDRFDQAQVNYSRAMYDVAIKPIKGTGSISLQLSTEIPADIYYTFDSTIPDNFSAKYPGKAIEVPAGAHAFKVVAYRNGKPSGRTLNFAMEDLEKRLKGEE